MEPRPVQDVQTPSYPTRREVLSGAAGVALASLCGHWPILAATKGGTTIVAPIFEHGDGRGATGCIVVSPPVFLSEEEAMQIIREEVAKKGIQLGAGEVFKGVGIPHRLDGEEIIATRNDELPGKLGELYYKAFEPKPLRLDALDPRKRIAVKYVSRRDYDDLGGEVTAGTAAVYDFKETATYVASQVKKQGKEPVYVGVFYDPFACMDSSFSDVVRKSWEKREEEAKSKSKVLLRQQAQDFSVWLEEKKVIK